MNAPYPVRPASVWAEARAGVRDMAPVMVAAVPIGLLFGTLCRAKGLAPAEVMLMSSLVFAGGAEFAAIGLWTTPAPIAALVFSTLLINARHVLMGVSLRPKMRAFRGWRLYAAFYFLTDESWALAERRALTQPISATYWFVMAALLPIAWVGSTVTGSILGPLLGDPKQLGADFAFTALFIGLVAAFWRGRVTAWTIAASGAASALVEVTAGAPWHVAAGATAGIAAAYFAADPDPADGKDAA
ncbi:AzlC family ABC transporter permease [Chelatococcus sp. SYSU_G07232]|uniref:AzlC family ABC transporter permease n=1 Tax=Chelatococcus albus TaxID=3047466 RepID=A0ABT7AGU6_9HYPH|nr:AzlC family ABC transporter permease [Chelatococcus sp. SYSU_G07232]MDJ1158598.1 AzlC family ABC transporter permease [Chelatococcus sp. SYSU_G07232]